MEIPGLRLILILAALPFFSLQAETRPVERIRYGTAPEQFGDLRLPSGKGPFPVVILIHGGCWLEAYDLAYLDPLARWLTEKGYATWNIEYRRLGNPGGGWPGTFLDVANATDALRGISQKAPLDLNRVVTLGHSAGGQLALWLASRSKLAQGSELYLKGALPIHGVLGLAAITDLEQYRIGPAGSCHASVDLLLGGTPSTVPGRFKETSPYQLLPLGVPQVFLQGTHDDVVDYSRVQTYVKQAAKLGDAAMLLTIPKGGHFEATIPTEDCKRLLEESLRFLQNPPRLTPSS